MDWSNPTKTEDGKLDIPGTWLFLHYYDALTVLFRIENALRLFVYIVLKERFGPKWRDLDIASDEQGNTTIAALAKRRIEQTKTFGYLTYPIQSPLMHLTSGELIGLILHDSYWPIFKEYFRAARSVVTLKLQEIGAVRNALAHFRPVSANDVGVVKLNARQMLEEVERTLIEVISCADTVPTNTEDPWYKDLRTLTSDNLTVGFSQSRDELWSRLTLCYKSAQVSEISFPPGNYLWRRVTTVSTPAMLEAQEALKNHVLFATERSCRLKVEDDSSLNAEKEVALTFSRRTLSENYEEIRYCLERILGQIAEETNLLCEDQLARGGLVSVVTVTAERKKYGENRCWWDIPDAPLRSASPASELPEYWGEISGRRDFISDTEDYPWMPVKICEGFVPPF